MRRCVCAGISELTLTDFSFNCHWRFEFLGANRYRPTPYAFSLREKVRLRGNGKLTSKVMLTHLVKNLRRSRTDAEFELWQALRSRQVEEAKFRHQYPIGQYKVDFVCFEARLVIEVDDGQHMFQEGDDRRRTEFLESKGLTVLRFDNLEVLNNLEGVVFKVIERLSDQRSRSRSPKPSPSGRGL